LIKKYSIKNTNTLKEMVEKHLAAVDQKTAAAVDPTGLVLIKAGS